MTERPMTGRKAFGRRQIDQRMASIRPLAEEPRPHRGWIRAIRDALGMSSAELATRLGVSQQSVTDLEHSEERETIKLETLRRAGAALDCELVYFLIPRRSLDDAVTRQARSKATEHLGSVAHHSRLEDQAVGDDETTEQIDALADQLVDRRGLWSETAR